MGLNTSPATWAAGEIPTAAKMNTEIRDAITGIQAAWTTYVPTWGGGSSLGDGTITAAYLRVGKTVHVRVVITMGAGTTYGGSGWTLTLPVAPLNSSPVGLLCQLVKSSGPSYYDGRGIITSASGTGTVSLQCAPTTAGGANRAVLNTQPFTWAAGDVLVLNGTYQAA